MTGACGRGPAGRNSALTAVASRASATTDRSDGWVRDPPLRQYAGTVPGETPGSGIIEGHHELNQWAHPLSVTLFSSGKRKIGIVPEIQLRRDYLFKSRTQCGIFSADDFMRRKRSVTHTGRGRAHAGSCNCWWPDPAVG